MPSGLEHVGPGDRVVLVSNPANATSLLNFNGNSVYLALPNGVFRRRH